MKELMNRLNLGLYLNGKSLKTIAL